RSGTAEHLAIKPQMVDKYASTNKGLKWSFTLRDGLKFHDGAAVTAEDAVESIKRWSKKDPLGRLLAAHTGKIAPADKKTFTLELSEPFGLVLEALGKPSSNVPFVMPARIAATSESEQIKETIGSGPFRFDARRHEDRKSTRLNSSHVSNLVCRLLLEKKKARAARGRDFPAYPPLGRSCACAAPRRSGRRSRLHRVPT